MKGKKGFESVLEVVSEHWRQREHYVDDLGNSLVNKVEDLKATAEDMMQGTEKTSSYIFSRNYNIFKAAFKQGET